MDGCGVMGGGRGRDGCLTCWGDMEREREGKEGGSVEGILGEERVRGRAGVCLARIIIIIIINNNNNNNNNKVFSYIFLMFKSTNRFQIF